MNAIPFDTHRVVKRLKEAGFSEPQAETVTDVLRESRDTELSNLATKTELTSEIGLLRTEMQTEFAKVRTEMQTEFAKVRGETAAEFAKVRGEMAAEFAKVRSEMAAEFAKVRSDTAAVRSEMAAEFAKVRSEAQDEFGKVRSAFGLLHSDIEQLRTDAAKSQFDLLKWVIGLLLVQGGLVVALMRLLSEH